jgi:DNA polymerase III delta prime subunit
MNNFVIIKKNYEEKKTIDKSDLLFHKYINTIIHKDIYQKVENLVKKDFMNLFLYGPEGSGKYTVAKFYIQKYLGFDPKLTNEIFKYESKELEYYKGKNHIELIINNYNFNDNNLVTSFLDNKVNKNNFRFSGEKNIILIKNSHKMKTSVLNIFLFYMEKYYQFNTFIFISSSGNLSKYLGVFCCIRIPQVTEEKLKELCYEIYKKEKIKKNDTEINKIIKLSKKNIKTLKNLIDFSYLNGKYEQFENPINDKLKFLFKIMKKKNINSLIIIRELLNELLVDNLDHNDILKYLLIKFKNENNSGKINNDKIIKIIEILKDTSIKLVNCLRPIIIFEFCIIEIMELIK